MCRPNSSRGADTQKGASSCLPLRLAQRGAAQNQTQKVLPQSGVILGPSHPPDFVGARGCLVTLAMSILCKKDSGARRRSNNHAISDSFLLDQPNARTPSQEGLLVGTVSNQILHSCAGAPSSPGGVRSASARPLSSALTQGKYQAWCARSAGTRVQGPPGNNSDHPEPIRGNGNT